MKKKAAFKPNPLFVIGAVFAASFFGRAVTLAEEAGNASVAEKQPAKPATTAAAASAHAPVAPEAAQKAPAHQPPSPAPPSASAAFLTGEPATLLEAIRQRSAQLDEREAAVLDRERLLDVVEKRLGQRAAELKALKDELDKRLSVAETAVSADVTRLAKMYETMKPAKAGEIFNAMDPSFAAGFLTQMNSESAALILANMQTDKAYAASVIIAGRNAAVNRR